MLLQELIPLGAVLQVWKTRTFRDYDSSVFKRNIPTLNPSYITWASWDPCPLALYSRMGSKSRRQMRSFAVPCWSCWGSSSPWLGCCGVSAGQQKQMMFWLVPVPARCSSLCWYRCSFVSNSRCWGLAHLSFFVPFPWGWCLPQGGRSGNQKYSSFRLLLLNSALSVWEGDSKIGRKLKISGKRGKNQKQSTWVSWRQCLDTLSSGKVVGCNCFYL